MAQVTITKAERSGDQITVTGTVDGVPTVVQVWNSHLTTLPTRAAKVTYAAQQLAASAPAAPASVDLAASVTV